MILSSHSDDLPCICSHVCVDSNLLISLHSHDVSVWLATRPPSTFKSNRCTRIVAVWPTCKLSCTYLRWVWGFLLLSRIELYNSHHQLTGSHAQHLLDRMYSNKIVWLEWHTFRLSLSTRIVTERLLSSQPSRLHIPWTSPQVVLHVLVCYFAALTIF